MTVMDEARLKALDVALELRKLGDFTGALLEDARAIDAYLTRTEPAAEAKVDEVEDADDAERALKHFAWVQVPSETHGATAPGPAPATPTESGDRIAATATIYDASVMTPAGRLAVAHWLREQALSLVERGSLYASEFTSRYAIAPGAPAAGATPAHPGLIISETSEPIASAAPAAEPAPKKQRKPRKAKAAKAKRRAKAGNGAVTSGNGADEAPAEVVVAEPQAEAVSEAA